MFLLKFRNFKVLLNRDWISDNSLDIRAGTIRHSVDRKLFRDTEAEREFQTLTKKDPEGTRPEAFFLTLNFKWLDYPCNQKCSVIKGPLCHCSPCTNHSDSRPGAKQGEDARHSAIPTESVYVG